MECDERDDQTRLLFDVSSSTAAAKDDLEWIKWVRVAWWAGNRAPAWLDRDAARQYAFDTLQPDIVDWYTGLDMDRGQFFRRRGVAACTGSGWEYDQDFAMGGNAFAVEHFGGNGIEQNEDGSRVFQKSWEAYAMEHFSPRWQQVELQGQCFMHFSICQWDYESVQSARTWAWKLTFVFVCRMHMYAL